VDVDVTVKKYVRAIKGAAPGLVTYRNETTLRVVPEAPEQWSS
jgi:predicted ribosome quality control (RQC) complex YloA/Tae2 family protein